MIDVAAFVFVHGMGIIIGLLGVIIVLWAFNRLLRALFEPSREPKINHEEMRENINEFKKTQEWDSADE